MNRIRWMSLAGTSLLLAAGMTLWARDQNPPQGFLALFNGKDLSGWKVPRGDNGHWKVVDGVIDYDARSEARGNKGLWTEKSFGDFVLRLDWRMKTDEPGYRWRGPVPGPHGNSKKNADGKTITEENE